LDVRTRQWKWWGNVLKISSDKNLEVAMTWAPEGKCRREMLWRTVYREREHLGYKTWRETERERLSPETGWLEGRGSILHKEGRE